MFTQGLLLYYNIFFAFFQAHSLCRQDFRIYKISRETIVLFLSLNLYLQPWRVLVLIRERRFAAQTSTRHELNQTDRNNGKRKRNESGVRR